MTDERIETILSLLPPSQVMADVGCDHGYMAKYALERGIAEKVYISDISKKSLQKAERLLKEEIKAGRCVPVLADGMKGIKSCDLLLIAGLGGEEIVRILKEGYLPEKFVFSPMKNPEKLRAYLVEKGAKIERDFTFGEGYFYEAIAGRNVGKSAYSEREILYGKENLLKRGPSFLNKIKTELLKTQDYLKRNVSEKSFEKLKQREKELSEILYGS